MEVVDSLHGRMLWVVRHGESTWNAAGRMQRQISHPPLTARGLAQAYAAGYRLRDRQIRRVITSDAVRASQTARAIATVLDVETVVDPRWRERGWADGQRPVAVGAAHVESLEDPEPRITNALNDISQLDCVTAIVTHGDIVCALLAMLPQQITNVPPWTVGTSVPNGAVVGLRLDRFRAWSRRRGL